MTRRNSRRETAGELRRRGVRAPILNNAPDHYRPTASELQCSNPGQILFYWTKQTGTRVAACRCKSKRCEACAPSRQRELAKRLLEGMHSARVPLEDVVFLTTTFARPDGAMRYREGAAASPDEAASRITECWRNLMGLLEGSFGGSRVSGMSDRVECPVFGCSRRPLLDSDRDNGITGRGARKSLERHLAQDHGYSGIELTGGRVRPRVRFFDASGVRRRVPLQFPEKVHSFRITEAHKDRQGWPHNHGLLVARELTIAVREAAEIEGRSRPRVLKCPDGSTVRVSDLLQEAGFGPKGGLEIPRSHDAVLGYVTKMAGDMAGELTKSSQSPFYSVSGLRQHSNSLGFLPPVHTDPDALGVIMQLSQPMPAGNVAAAVQALEKRAQSGEWVAAWIGTKRANVSDASDSQVLDRKHGELVGRPLRGLDRATLFEILEKASGSTRERNGLALVPRRFSFGALVWAQQFQSGHGEFEDLAAPAAPVFKEWSVPSLTPALKSGKPLLIRRKGRSGEAAAAGGRAPSGLPNEEDAHPSPRGKDSVGQLAGSWATERSARRSQGSINGLCLLAEAPPLPLAAAVGCGSLPPSSGGACSLWAVVTPGGLVQGGPREAGGPQAPCQTRGSVCGRGSARRAPPGGACGPL